MYVTRYVTGESRRTCANPSDPNRTYLESTQDSYARGGERLGRILTGTFGTIDEAVGQ